MNPTLTRSIRRAQWRVLMIVWALDHLLLTIFTLGNCRPYEMISSALWVLELEGKFFGVWLRPAVDFILRPLGANHCAASYAWQAEIYKAHP